MSKEKGKKNKDSTSANLITEMVITPGENVEKGGGGLVVEPEADEEKSSVEASLALNLDQTGAEVLEETGLAEDPLASKSWEKARALIHDFNPAPWFIWRISNFVLGKSGQINKLSEGFLLGLRRLVFAAASDPVLGIGKKVNNVRQALEVLEPDVIAAISVIHSVCKKLSAQQFERIWRPIIDDALLRCHIGCFVGAQNPNFGPGRGMLAGFAGRCGLAILIATGELDQAREALESLAAGGEIGEVGYKVYQCDPLQVSALLLSASGCGRDAAFGTVSFGSKDSISMVQNDEQTRWLAAFTITESVRTGRSERVPENLWKIMGFNDDKDKSVLLDDAKKVVRRGHGWNWLISG